MNKKLFNVLGMEVIKSMRGDTEGTDKDYNARYLHCVRVSELCEKFAKELKLNEREIFLVKISGLLHDIKKFDKNKLETIDNHALKGARYTKELLETKYSNILNAEEIDKITLAIMTHSNKDNYSFKELSNINILGCILIEVDVLDHFNIDFIESKVKDKSLVKQINYFEKILIDIKNYKDNFSDVGKKYYEEHYKEFEKYIKAMKHNLNCLKEISYEVKNRCENYVFKDEDEKEINLDKTEYIELAHNHFKEKYPYLVNAKYMKIITKDKKFTNKYNFRINEELVLKYELNIHINNLYFKFTKGEYERDDENYKLETIFNLCNQFSLYDIKNEFVIDSKIFEILNNDIKESIYRYSNEYVETAKEKLKNVEEEFFNNIKKK